MPGVFANSKSSSLLISLIVYIGMFHLLILHLLAEAILATTNLEVRMLAAAPTLVVVIQVAVSVLATRRKTKTCAQRMMRTRSSASRR
jgi:hypothetical protein